MRELSIKEILLPEITLMIFLQHGRKYCQLNGYIDLSPLWIPFLGHGMSSLKCDEELKFGEK